MDHYYLKVNELLAARTPFVSAIVVDTTGSVPQNAGSKMLVTAAGHYYGTVGGGKVEKRAIEEAVSLLEGETGEHKTHFVNWNLNKDIGMTCGGSVKIFFETHNRKVWNIVVFGAGHVSAALVQLLMPLDCHVTCFDPRGEWLEKLPDSPKLAKVLAPDMPGNVKSLPDDAFVVLVTMGHSTDMPILLEILKTKKFPYIGVIGSKAKAARLRKDVLDAGLPERSADRYFCPVGLPIGSNHPHEIAISIVAQLIAERDRIYK